MVLSGAKNENDVIKMKNELLEEKIRLVESARTSYKAYSGKDYQTREKENFRSLINSKNNFKNYNLEAAKDFFV